MPGNRPAPDEARRLAQREAGRRLWRFLLQPRPDQPGEVVRTNTDAPETGDRVAPEDAPD